MKIGLRTCISALLLTACLNHMSAQSPPPSGTAFTYQGQLLVGGVPTNALYDLRFKLIDVVSNTVTVSRTNSGVSVQNGLFTTMIDLGPVFDGRAYSLQIGVRPSQPGGGGGAFVDLNPPNPISPAPMALFAGTLGGLSASSFWQTGGNPGVPGGVNFLGTSNNQPLSLGVNGQVALQIIPTIEGVANLIGGSVSNMVLSSSKGSSIGGGGWNNPLFGCGFGPNAVNANNSFICSGSGNTIVQGSDSSLIGAGDCNVIDFNSAEAFIGSGFLNTIAAATSQPNGSRSAISGGSQNRVGLNNFASSIGGGLNNQTGNDVLEGTIAGGFNNRIQFGNEHAIGGGQANRILGGNAATIAGGFNNMIETNSHTAAIGGGGLNLIQAGSSTCFIGGGSNNTIHAYINAPKPDETIGATIGGGLHNTITDYGAMAFIGGGVNNAICCALSFVGGGEGNNAEATSAVICGGELNDVQAGSGSIGGGENNTIYSGGSFGTIPGGSMNVVGGPYSFAAGRQAKANHAGCFIWSDSSGAGIDFNSAADAEFAARARGGVRFVTAIDISGNPTAGVTLASGGSSWSSICDRNAKKNFAPINGEAVLQKLADVPIESWNYKWESDDAVPNIGPMAQDFKQAFYPGRDDKSITTLEFDGVELAAIEALNRKVAALESELRRKDAATQELNTRLERLEQLLLHQANGVNP